MDAISALYPKLSVGGYVIVDDYCIRACRQAIHDYRDANGITDDLIGIDQAGAFWQRTR